MTTPHPHAAILRALADGKQIQDTAADPQGNTIYVDILAGAALLVLAKTGGRFLRVKPETVTVNGVQCPKPKRLAVHEGHPVKIICGESSHWLIYETKEEARTVFDALCLPFSKETT